MPLREAGPQEEGRHTLTISPCGIVGDSGLPAALGRTSSSTHVVI